MEDEQELDIGFDYENVLRQVIWCAKEWIPATVTRTWFVCSCV